MRNEFLEALLLEAKLDSRILFLTSDLGYGVIERFQEELPNQFFNLGITEQSAISIAAGLASKGFRPFVYSIANFPTFRAMEQIRNDVNYMDLPVTIVALGEGFSYGTAGYSHHLVEDISAIRAFGGISIYSPTAEHEVRESVKRIVQRAMPALIRLGKAPKNLTGSDLTVSVSGGTRFNQGSDGHIVFHGGILDEILETRSILSKFGVNPLIHSCFDFQVENISELLLCDSNIPIMIVEEHMLAGGLGTMFLEIANEVSYVGKIKRMGISKIDKSVVGSQSFLRKYHGLDAASIASTYMELLSAK
jgi:transketolase